MLDRHSSYTYVLLHIRLMQSDDQKFSELLLQKGHGILPSCLTSCKQEGWKVRNTALTEAYISPEQFIPKTHKLFYYFGETLGGLRYTHFHFFCLHI